MLTFTRLDKCKQCGTEIPLKLNRKLLVDCQVDCTNCNTNQLYRVNLGANILYWVFAIGGSCLLYNYLSLQGNVDYLLPVFFFGTLAGGVWLSVQTLLHK